MAERKNVLKKGEVREPLSPISLNHASTRTPHRRRNHSSVKTPSAKTPNAKTPNAKTSTTNTDGVYDRFIPNRALMNNELGHHILLNQNEEVEKLDARILQMKIKAPQTKEGEVATKMMYTKSRPTPAKFKSTRHVPSLPDKILDAPEIVDDYYLNLLDWGKNGLIAVPLYNAVYLWNSDSGTVEELFGDNPITDDNLVVTSVKWITEGLVIAVGLSNGNVELWDASTNKRIRTMPGQSTRIGSLDWNNHILTSGGRSGAIHNHDVRVPSHHISSYLNHTQEICGLQWSPDGKYLASGGNDNILNIWDAASAITPSTNGGVNEVHTPIHSLYEHMAAVKAVSWCPWQRNVLASGGGTADRHIRVWNVGTGVCLNSLDTMGQISGILWSSTYKEIMCSHDNQMTIWKYPSMTREAELSGHQGHTGRILNIVSSPNGHFVASAGADETLRLWKCFEPDQKKTSSRTTVKKIESSQPRPSIR